MTRRSIPDPTLPIVRVPPFPHALRRSISERASGTVGDAADALAALVDQRVGGTYWAAQPVLPASCTIVARIRDRDDRRIVDARAAAHPGAVCLWLDRTAAQGEFPCIAGECDPWHIIEQADEIWCRADDELAFLAAAAGRTVRVYGEGRFAALDATRITDDALLACAGATLIETVRYTDPFSGKPMSAEQAIALSGFWRQLIDANRSIHAAAGMAFWKRDNVEALLWGGQPVRFVGTAAQASTVPPGSRIAAWGARISPAVTARLEARQVEWIDVEDGFIRSAGLGADCVPPSSIVVDRGGPHYDPALRSDLEALIERNDASPALLARADRLAALIVESGVSKYGAAESDAAPLARTDARQHVLVPGQVEDDRSVLRGGGEVAGNLDLLRRVRAAEPDAFIIYKPHPDVEAGHRNGAVPDADARQFADRIVRDAPIARLLDMVDAVHVLTSLVGFEALLRGKDVTAHGTPFYAGWGLTRDLGPVPPQRTARPTLSQLTAAVLLRYPRYLDPVSRLPCPPEVLVEWLAAGAPQATDPIVLLRRLQGRVGRLARRA